MGNFIDCKCGCRTYYQLEKGKKPEKVKCGHCRKSLKP